MKGDCEYVTGNGPYVGQRLHTRVDSGSCGPQATWERASQGAPRLATAAAAAAAAAASSEGWVAAIGEATAAAAVATATAATASGDAGAETRRRSKWKRSKGQAGEQQRRGMCGGQRRGRRWHGATRRATGDGGERSPCTARAQRRGLPPMLHVRESASRRTSHAHLVCACQCCVFACMYVGLWPHGMRLACASPTGQGIRVGLP